MPSAGIHLQLAYSPNLHGFRMNNKPLTTNPVAKLAQIHFISREPLARYE
jgi:hypothetical protein